VGVPAEWQTLIHREAVVGETMTGRLPPGAGGPPAGGAPPTDRGPGGELWGHLECRFLYVWVFGSPDFLYRVFDTHFCTHRDEGTHEPTGICISIFFVKHL
jgi:hypothetical protein